MIYISFSTVDTVSPAVIRGPCPAGIAHESGSATTTTTSAWSSAAVRGPSEAASPAPPQLPSGLWWSCGPTVATARFDRAAYRDCWCRPCRSPIA